MMNYSKSSICLYLDGINDPGNLGTIIRTAAAFAVDFVAASPTSVDFYNPKTIRASAGLVFKLPLERIEAPTDFFDRLSANDINLLGSALKRRLTSALSPRERCVWPSVPKRPVLAPKLDRPVSRSFAYEWQQRWNH